MRQSFRAATHHILTISCTLRVFIIFNLSHKKLFQAGNINVDVRPDLLYFSIWRVYLKKYQKHNLWPMKTAKTLCTSSRRLVWWNVIHSTKISVVLLALKAKGQKLMNAPRISDIHVYPVELQLNKACLCDKETPFLDLDIKVVDNDIHTSVYDKREYFWFPILNFRDWVVIFLDSHPHSIFVLLVTSQAV